MKAAVFHKPKDIRYETVPDPILEAPTDAIIRVTTTTICGSDLHIYNGLFPQFRKLVLGHEFMGIVEEVGSEVRRLRVGDRVVVPFPIACGHCFFCEHALPVSCENSNPQHYGPLGGMFSQKGGGLFGYTDLYGGYSGGQAEAVRVPFADYGPRKVPDDLSDEQVLFLSDIIPTGWAGADWAGVQAGDTVAVFGCGPVGLMALKAAHLRQAKQVIAIDPLPYRLNVARELCQAEVINATDSNVVEAIWEMTDGRGADACIDAVGLEADRGVLERLNAAVHMERGTMKVLENCFSAVRRGGTVAVLGVYATTHDNFPLGQWFDKGLQVRAGQVPVHNYIDFLLDLVATGKLVANDIISHRLPLSEVSQAYKLFNGREDHCVKIVLKP